MSEWITTRLSDIDRLTECVLCANDPETCGCTDNDDDEQGHCKNYKEREHEL